MKKLRSFFSQLLSYFGFDAFISYKISESAAYANTLHKNLSERYRIFLDKEELLKGDSLPSTLKSKLRHTSVLIVIATPGAANSYWMKKEIEYFSQKKKNPRIIYISFDNKAREKDFVAIDEPYENLQAGNVSDSTITDIRRTIGKLTKARIAFFVMTAIVTTLLVISLASYNIFRVEKYNHWLEIGKNHLRESRPDLAELAFSKAAGYTWSQDAALVELYTTARKARVLQSGYFVPHTMETVAIHAASVQGHPAVLFSDYNDSLLFVHYKGNKLPVTGIQGKYINLSSDSSSILIQTDQGIFNLKIREQLSANKIEVDSLGQVGRIFKHKGIIIIVIATEKHLSVRHYTEEGRLLPEKQVYVHAPAINEWTYDPESQSISAAFKKGPLPPWILFFRWNAPLYQPKTDMIPTSPAASLYALEASADNKRFVCRIVEEEDFFRPSVDKSVIFEPDDPHRKTIPLEEPFKHLKVLNDGKNYVSYLTEDKELKLIPYFDYVITKPQPFTLATQVQSYKLLGNLLLAAKDSGVYVYEDKRLVAIYSIPDKRINSIMVSPDTRFVTMETDSCLYIWRKPEKIMNKSVPSFENLSRELAGF